MKKTLFTAVAALAFLSGGAMAQDKEGFASDGGPGTTRIDSVSGLDLGSGRYTEVEWTYLKDRQAYGFKFERPETRADAEPKDDFMNLICSQPDKNLGNHEIQRLRIVLSGGTTMQASKLKDLEAEDRICKVLPKGAGVLLADEPTSLDYLVITMEN